MDCFLQAGRNLGGSARTTTTVHTSAFPPAVTTPSIIGTMRPTLLNSTNVTRPATATIPVQTIAPIVPTPVVDQATFIQQRPPVTAATTRINSLKTTSAPVTRIQSLPAIKPLTAEVRQPATNIRTISPARLSQVNITTANRVLPPALQPKSTAIVASSPLRVPTPSPIRRFQTSPVKIGTSTNRVSGVHHLFNKKYEGVRQAQTTGHLGFNSFRYRPATASRPTTQYRSTAAGPS